MGHGFCVSSVVRISPPWGTCGDCGQSGPHTEPLDQPAVGGPPLGLALEPKGGEGASFVVLQPRDDTFL